MGNREANYSMGKLNVYNDLHVGGGRVRRDNLAQRTGPTPRSVRNSFEIKAGQAGSLIWDKVARSMESSSQFSAIELAVTEN